MNGPNCINQNNDLENTNMIIFIKDYYNILKINKNYAITEIKKYLRDIDEKEINEMFNFIKIDSLTNSIKKIKKEIIHKKYLDEFISECYIFKQVNIDTHYKLFKLNEKEYLKFLQYYFLVDDYTFANYIYNDYSFVNNFNLEVKTYLINKIECDTKYITKEKRHTEITTLDNFIDICYFVQNPPIFLRKSDIVYNDEKIELMNKVAKDFNFDFDKINYLNIKIFFEYPSLKQIISVI